MRAARLAVPALLALTPAPVSAQETTRINLDGQGNELPDGGAQPALSADGRFAAFTNPTDTDPADTNGWGDIYVRDRLLGTTTLVSISTAGVQGDRSSVSAALSADGRTVLFTSSSSTLVANDTNGTSDVFVRDLETGVTERVSVDSSGAQGARSSNHASITPDGRHVCFWTASALVPDDTNINPDIYVHDRVTGLTERVSVDSDEQQTVRSNGVHSAISADGNLVLFSSWDGLVDGDQNGVHDVYLRDRAAGETHRISIAFDGSEPDDHCFPSGLSGDGRYVVFSSSATNLVAGVDGSWTSDAFLYDRALGTLTRISNTSAGLPGNGHSDFAQISSDGRTVVFESDASDLVPGDSNGVRDAFRYDTTTGALARLSVNSAGNQATAAIRDLCMSADGRMVAFSSWADQFVPADLNEASDCFLRGPALVGTRYCGPATTNSTGRSALISAVGSDLWFRNDLTLHAEDMPPNTFGFFLVSGSQSLITNPGGSQGDLCLGSPIGRYMNQIQSSGASGSFSIPLDLTNLPTFGPVSSGDTWNFTCWYRDANPALTSNFTDGLEVVFP